jgi:hypothetical protein
MGAVLVWAALSAGHALACSVPVFRYALERWPAAPYDAYVFNRGPLAAPHLKAVEALKAADRCVTLSLVDLAGKPDEAASAVWQRHGGAATPWMVVRYPSGLGIPIDAWSGRLTAEAAALALDSPARREVARRLLGGDCAVFLMLESGDRGADDAAARLVDAQLKVLEKSLELPKPEAGRWNDPVYDSKGPPALRVVFSLLRVARTDPAEGPFVRMLLGAKRDLDREAGPLVFPIFGRGRLLDALAGPQINKDTIEEVCGFLIGPCSCIVKDQNPGMDLLMAVDWDAALAGEASAIPKPGPLPLTGVSAFAEAGPSAGRAALVLYVLVGAAAGLAIVAGVGIFFWRKMRTD